MMNMNNFKADSISTMAVEAATTNQFNPDTCNNAGGYFQYYGTCYSMIFNPDWKAIGWLIYNFEDYSCGDFGTRYSKDVTIIDMDGNILFNDGVNYGSMIEEPDDESDFIDRVSGFLGLPSSTMIYMLTSGLNNEIIDELDHQ